ncbi:WD repeat, SAM and U-box domain-containing protein 1 [Folsomia candida]|uniref:WD repeat, SAM and U-box domain-containing protein 1 n=2 Tax=Folsomia candida TaxID=158441 RepID=A0A226D9D4_FOLCA|nr:WD repeat, SAM and U-box domain-containing protein 1 [Folsomia candida]
MATQEVRRLLQQCGLEEYAKKFEENHITDDELLELSKEDLADLIPSIGHRSKLSKAIVKLKSGKELEEKDDEFLSPPKLEDFSGPESVIHFESCIAKLYASILKESIAEVIKISEFRNSYNGNPTKYSPVRDLLAVFDQFSSRYKMDKYLLSRNFMIEPKEIVLDTDISFQSRSLGSRKQEYKNVTMQYISIKKSIQQLLRKPGFFSILQTNSNFNGENFSCFRDGKFVRDFNQPRETIFINLYYDDAEVANPLGSKSGKHKLANFYFSIIDLPQHLLSKLDNVILVASLKTEDLKLCSSNSVLRVITNELKELWEEGILFVHNGEQINLKTALAQDMIRKPLKPKHHHMLHYSSAIKQIGPLRQFWSMPFEARHKFFKTTAHVLLSLETFSPHSFACNDYELINLADTIENELLLGKFSKLATDEIVVTTKITKNGSDFEVGGYILLDYCREMPIFGRIDRIILDNDDCHFVVKKFSSEYIAQYAGYKLYESGLSILIDSNDDSQSSVFSGSILDEAEIRERGLNISPTLFSKPERKRNPPNFQPSNLFEDISPNHEELTTREPIINESSQGEIINQISDPIPIEIDGSFLQLHSTDELESGPLHQINFSNNKSNVLNVPTIQKKFYGFSIQSVLLGTESTRRILNEKIPAKRMLIREDRIAVTNALVDALIANLGVSPSKEALHQLALDLVTSYPELGDSRKKNFGSTMWFQNITHGSGSPDNPEPDEKVLEFLRQNKGQDVLPTMKSSTFMRRTVIREEMQQNLVGFRRIPSILPRLFDIKGMIVEDFNSRHPRLSLVMYERWPKASKLLLTYAEESGVDYQKKLDIRKPRCDLTGDDIALIAFSLLPHILPSCARKINPAPTGDNNISQSDSGPKPKRVKRSIKATDLDARNSLIIFRSKNTHVAEVLSENKNVAPLILALGSTYDLRIESYFVILDRMAIPCGDSFFVALDTCIKSFSVFYLPPPVEAKNVWLFLLHGIAGKPCDNSTLTPVVQALIGQIMPRL